MRKPFLTGLPISRGLKPTKVAMAAIAMLSAAGAQAEEIAAPGPLNETKPADALAQEVLKTDATAASSSALVAQRLTAFDLVRLAAGHIKGQRLAVDPDKLLGDKGYDSDAIRDDRTAWQAPGALSRIAHA
jgi:hypothetical protein